MTGQKRYAILLYCIQMDKVPFLRRECPKSVGFRKMRFAQTEREVHKATRIYPKINI